MSQHNYKNASNIKLLMIVGVVILVLVTLVASIFLPKPFVGLYPAKAPRQQSVEVIFPDIPKNSSKDAHLNDVAKNFLFLNIVLRANRLPDVTQLREPETVEGDQAAAPAKQPHIGIVAGHWGNDSGTICSDGLTEQAVNLNIAQQVRKILRTHGYRVDLLQEFDPRLNGYEADALVSIHADSCLFINELATGFKVARSAASFEPNLEDRLVSCLSEEYSAATNLGFHENSITPDMTSYHTFREIKLETPAAIIETGFLYLDRSMLVDQPDRVARGIARGVICFIESQ